MDAVNRQLIIARLKARDANPDMEASYQLFAELVTQVDSAEGLPFDLLSFPPGSEAIYRAFDAWLKLDEELGNMWMAEHNEVGRPFSEATGPRPLPKGAPVEKKRSGRTRKK